MNKDMPIGVFDSGLGGLTVLKALQKKLPNESFIYIGDTAHVPYGNKSKTAIINYTRTISKFLIDVHKVKMIIIACNTASAIAIKSLQKDCNIPVVDVIAPIKKHLLQDKSIKRIGVIGTYNTIQSKSYDKLLLTMNSDLQIFSQSCPLFVPIIEEGLENHHIAKLISKEYLSPLIQQNIQVLILGCTHYPIMKKTITASLPQGVKIIDSAETLSSYTQKYLNKNKKASRNSNIKTHLFITDGSEHFNQFARNILDDEFCGISNIKLF